MITIEVAGPESSGLQRVPLHSLKPVPIAILVALYHELGSALAVARAVGRQTTSVHERLQKAGAMKPVNVFSELEVKRLSRDYSTYRLAGKLDLLAKDMGRTKTFICRKARTLGLTSYRGPRRYISVWKYMPEEVARALLEKFKNSRLGMGQFCQKYGYDDLGFSKTMKGFFPDEWEHIIEAKVPHQSMYRIGRAFEYRVRDYLKDRGYVVTRSPRSGSVIDLMAVRAGEVVFVQCKRGGQLPVAEWNEFFELAESVKALPILAASLTGRGIDFWRLVDRKDGSKRRQPFKIWAPA